ncbi:beta-galactosidase [Fusarium albosuccineum]|uniref:beta-galactosidase n=1 Tax=Fusarium albosuccineum TaxID=1237068 RepID=A0A8H4NU92_9HYPO|nr:beta-galactosidase [Fusarium albosuccineum]
MASPSKSEAQTAMNTILTMDEPSHTSGNPASFISDNPAWKEQYVEMAGQMVAHDKNHASVFMWSLGNEAFYGQNQQAMYGAIKEMDQTRLMHYERDYETKMVDVLSRMYSSVDEIVNDFAKAEEWTKPLYMEAFYKYPRLTGGFVWEWANHGLRTKTKDDEEYMAYDGDFGDEPNDYNFIMDGVLFSNHTPTPGLIEHAKAIEPVQTLSLDANKVTIINRYDFIGLEHLRCNWEIVAEGKIVPRGEVEIPTGIKPHTEVTLTLDGFSNDLISDIIGEAYLQLAFKLKQDTNWVSAGHQVAFGQLQISKPVSIATLQSSEPSTGKPAIERASQSLLLIHSASKSSTWGINLAEGALVSWKRSNVELLTTPLPVDFYRALTDNDRGGHGKEWLEQRLHQTSHHVRRVQSSNTDDTLQVQITGRIAPPVLAWAVDVVTTYHSCGDTLRLHVHGKPHGLRLPETFARIGVTAGLAGISGVRWWGRGPGESYVDKTLSQGFGNWSSSVHNLWVDYEFPQDGGNRTDVRWVEFAGGKGRVLRAKFGDIGGASFSAAHYTTRDVDNSTHPYELRKKKREDTIVRLDWKYHGLGTASCGPATLPEYQLRTDNEFDFEILLD